MIIFSNSNRFFQDWIRYPLNFLETVMYLNVNDLLHLKNARYKIVFSSIIVYIKFRVGNISIEKTRQVKQVVIHRFLF